MRPIVILRNETTGDFVDFTRGTQVRLTQLDGTGEPAASVSTSKYAGMDGSYLGAAYIEKRNIVLDFDFLPVDIERSRLKLYDVIQTRRPIRVYYATKRVNTYCDGIVESFQVDNFKDSKTTGQISVICPSPFWQSNATHKASAGSYEDMFHFPFAIDEKGVPLSAVRNSKSISIDTDGEATGLTVILTFSGTVMNPYIHNELTGEILKINSGFSEKSTVTITTGAGNKKVYHATAGDPKQSSILSTFSGSWLQIQKGHNEFTVGADFGQGFLDASFYWQDQYIGV